MGLHVLNGSDCCLLVTSCLDCHPENTTSSKNVSQTYCCSLPPDEAKILRVARGPPTHQDHPPPSTPRGSQICSGLGSRQAARHFRHRYRAYRSTGIRDSGLRSGSLPAVDVRMCDEIAYIRLEHLAAFPEPSPERVSGTRWEPKERHVTCHHQPLFLSSVRRWGCRVVFLEQSGCGCRMGWLPLQSLFTEPLVGDCCDTYQPDASIPVHIGGCACDRLKVKNSSFLRKHVEFRRGLLRKRLENVPESARKSQWNEGLSLKLSEHHRKHRPNFVRCTTNLRHDPVRRCSVHLLNVSLLVSSVSPIASERDLRGHFFCGVRHGPVTRAISAIFNE